MAIVSFRTSFFVKFDLAEVFFLAQIFHTVFVRNIPIMNLKTKSEARRFITMIDTFYDNKTRIVASGFAPYWDLFQPEEMSEEVRALACCPSYLAI